MDTTRRSALLSPHRLAAAAWLLPVLISAAATAQIRYAQIATGPARTEHGLVYDAGRDRVVFFGGALGTNVFNDTWEFDGSSWTQRSSTSRPPQLLRPAMVYDAARGVVLLFGGSDQAGNMRNDTWTWNGTDWTRHTPASAPSVRSGAALAYDSARQVVVLFGGWVPSGADSSETWEWDGSNWTRRTPTNFPLARGAHRMAYDAPRGVVLLFGGWSTPQSGTLGDTWAYDGTNWQQQTGAPRPSNRCDQGFCYDEDRDRIVAFGGLQQFVGNPPSPVVVGDTWEWDGSGWTQRFASSPPSSRTYTEMVWDTTRRRLVLHGGSDATVNHNTTWSLTPQNPASVTSYGTACTGSAGVPALEPMPYRLPHIDGTFDVMVSGGLPVNGLAFIVMGLSNTTWNGQAIPVDLTSLGLPGCLAWTSADATAAVGLVNGAGVWTGALCNCPQLAGQSLYMQALLIDPNVVRPLPGVVTNALDVRIGAR